MTVHPLILHALATERVADLHRQAADQRLADDDAEPSEPSLSVPPKRQEGLVTAAGQPS